MKLDILVFAAHPDDAELSCSGTLAKHVAKGQKVGIIDLTEGELGTRGTREKRKEEASRSAEILGLSVRSNLKLEDGFFEYTKANQLKIIEQVRAYQPHIVLINAPEDRHPDHGKAARLCSDAIFLSGLRKVETKWNGVIQQAWRPQRIFHYIQDYALKPDFIVDISDFWETKKASILAFDSQFYNPNSKEPESPVSSKAFLDGLEGRALNWGRLIGAKYGEGFIAQKTIGVNDLTAVM